MAERIDWVALAVFLFFFILVTVMGFLAARWRAGPVSEHLDEWGLGGGDSVPGLPGFWSAAISTPRTP